MTLNQLTYFQKIAQLEHFRLAANELNISQPSLSRSMDTLENLKKTDETSHSPNTVRCF